MHLTVLDIEASGFGPESYPIEVGIAKHSGERYCSLVVPPPEWQYWSEEAEAVHGISRSLLAEKGVPVAQVCAELNDLLMGEIVYSDAWSHDQSWLNKLYYHVEIIPSFTLRAIEYLATEEQLLRWDAVKQSVIDELDLTRHRASGDALIVQQTYFRLSKNTSS